jgi:hypothetical protein
VALCDGAGPAGLLKQARAGAAKRFAAAMDSYPLLFVTLDAAGGLGVALAIAATTATPRPSAPSTGRRTPRPRARPLPHDGSRPGTRSE